MMRLLSVFFIICSVNLVYCQWASRVFLVDHVNYFLRVMTEVVHDLEEKGFCNLKLDDYSVDVDQQMYKWHVTGTTNYTNGFLVSIEKIEITDVSQQMSSRTVDGVVQSIANVHGRMILRNLKIGYDVLAQMNEDGEHTFTGTYVHELAQFKFWIMKNLHTKEISTRHMLEDLPGRLGIMVYMPASHLTEVLSRTYIPSQAFTGVDNWARDHFLPAILDVATNRISFPEVCLDCR